MFLKEGSGDARVGELKAELHSRFGSLLLTDVNWAGNGYCLGRRRLGSRASCPFSLAWPESPVFFVLSLSGLIWLLVALFLEGCQARSPAFPIAGHDHPLAGRQAP